MPVPALVSVPAAVPRILAREPPVVPLSVNPKAPVTVPVLVRLMAPAFVTMLEALPRVSKPL